MTEKPESPSYGMFFMDNVRGDVKGCNRAGKWVTHMEAKLEGDHILARLLAHEQQLMDLRKITQALGARKKPR